VKSRTFFKGVQEQGPSTVISHLKWKKASDLPNSLFPLPCPVSSLHDSNDRFSHLPRDRWSKAIWASFFNFLWSGKSSPANTPSYDSSNAAVAPGGRCFWRPFLVLCQRRWLESPAKQETDMDNRGGHVPLPVEARPRQGRNNLRFFDGRTSEHFVIPIEGRFLSACKSRDVNPCPISFLPPRLIFDPAHLPS